MEGGSKGYWKRRAVNGPSRRRRSLPRAELGGGRRCWRVRLPLRLRILVKKASAPRRLLARLRDAYVRLMVRLEHSEAVSGYGGWAVPPPYGNGAQLPPGYGF